MEQTEIQRIERLLKEQLDGTLRDLLKHAYDHPNEVMASGLSGVVMIEPEVFTAAWYQEVQLKREEEKREGQ